MQNIREIDVSEITAKIREMCIKINYALSDDVRQCLNRAHETERSPLGRQILEKLQENLQIADSEKIPICQDTGMAVIFLDVGQDVHFTGGSLTDAVNEGVRQGYTQGYLRKSVVSDPLERVNTGDNTPAIVHVGIVPGSRVHITVAPKGAGSENMSRVFMLKPADGREGIIRAVVSAVQDAGPNACPPMFIGVGIGGNFEKCAELAKKALTLPADCHNECRDIASMEETIMERANELHIGPAGLGGSNTVLGVRILTWPTHIASLPVGVNICCHVNRHIEYTI